MATRPVTINQRLVTAVGSEFLDYPKQNGPAAEDSWQARLRPR